MGFQKNYINDLISFIKDNKNDWQEKIQAPPYNIAIKQDENFKDCWMFNYNQWNSDFFLPIVKACRGTILKITKEDVSLVECAFTKFGNYGEPYLDEIDWKSITVQEKVDGSIITLYFFNGKWHWKSHRTFEADTKVLDIPAIDNDEKFEPKTFLDLIIQSCKYKYGENYFDWINDLPKNKCFTFELTSPYMRIVIPYYKTNLTLLGSRCTDYPYQEYSGIDTKNEFKLNFDTPKLFPLSSLKDCIEAAKNLKGQEGFVGCDKYFNRCKIKSPIYVMNHRAKGDVSISEKYLYELYKNGNMDDVISTFPEYKDAAENLIKNLSFIKESLEEIKKDASFVYSLTNNRKSFAEFINKNKKGYDKAYYFMFAEKDVNINSYIESLTWSKYLDIKNYLNLK